MLNAKEKLSHLGLRAAKLMRNYAIFLLVMSFLLSVAPFLVLLFQVILFLLALLSFGTLFLVDGYWGLIKDSASATVLLVELYDYLGYAIGIAIAATSLALIITYYSGKDYKSKSLFKSLIGVLIFSILSMAVFLIIFNNIEVTNG